jgi:hypothetical protein
MPKRRFEKLQRHCTCPRSAERSRRSLNPRHFPQVGGSCFNRGDPGNTLPWEPAHGSGCPVLGDFEGQNPPELGGWGANAGMNGTSQTASNV